MERRVAGGGGGVTFSREGIGLFLVHECDGRGVAKTMCLSEGRFGD